MRKKLIATTIALLLVSGTASATDGYFSHGYGMKAKGRGGVAYAMTDNAYGGANNPATMVFSGNRFEVGLDLFSPQRKAERTGLGPGLDGSVKSGKTLFPIPEMGYNHMYRDDLAFGVSVFGNGGMNTSYPGGQFNCGFGSANMLCGSGTLGVDLTQLIIAPTASWAFSKNQSIGIAPQFAYQRFKATGLQAFTMIPGLSTDPSKVTNNGYDNSYGMGLRIGYYARLSPTFSLGVTYASKIKMSKFKDYAGLFADGGRFDIPENYGAGVAWHPTHPLTLSVDYEMIKYSGVPSVGDHSLIPTQLGAKNGPGFGWQDVNVWKFGVEYASSDRLTWRAGYNRSDNPVQSQDVTFNILAPGVVTDHVTLGMTYKTASDGEVTVAYMHAFNNSVQGASILPAFFGYPPAGNEKISMHQNSLGISYSWKL